MNFPLVLLILAILTGGIYLLDTCYFVKNRRINESPGRIIEYSRSFFSGIFCGLITAIFYN